MRPGAVLSEVIRPAFQEFLRTTVVLRVHDALSRFKPEPPSLLRDDENGYHYCRTMLPTVILPGGFGDWHNFFAFTANAHEVLFGFDQPEEEKQAARLSRQYEVRYRYDYVFGEPSLQESLLTCVRGNRLVGEREVQNMLANAAAVSLAGVYLGYEVALSLLYKGSFPLKDLVEGTIYEQYSATRQHNECGAGSRVVRACTD